MLGGSFVHPCIPTDFLVDHFPFGGQQRGFLLSSSVSSSITHLGVILCLLLSSLLFTFNCCYDLRLIVV